MGQWVTVMGQKCDPLSGVGDRVIGQVVAMLGGGYLGREVTYMIAVSQRVLYSSFLHSVTKCCELRTQLRALNTQFTFKSASVLVVLYTRGLLGQCHSGGRAGVRQPVIWCGSLRFHDSRAY